MNSVTIVWFSVSILFGTMPIEIKTGGYYNKLNNLIITVFTIQDIKNQNIDLTFL